MFARKCDFHLYKICFLFSCVDFNVFFSYYTTVTSSREAPQRGRCRSVRQVAALNPGNPDHLPLHLPIVRASSSFCGAAERVRFGAGNGSSCCSVLAVGTSERSALSALYRRHPPAGRIQYRNRTANAVVEYSLRHYAVLPSARRLCRCSGGHHWRGGRACTRCSISLCVRTARECVFSTATTRAYDLRSARIVIIRTFNNTAVRGTLTGRSSSSRRLVVTQTL